MSDPTPPDPHDPDQRLGAWLDGDLSESRAQAVAAEIESDPELAARLEALREVRERLAGSGTAEVPEGFAARVRQAVAAEAGSPPAGEEATHGDGPPAAASLADARARRTRRRRLVAAGSVAAALVAVAVIAPLAGDLPTASDDAGSFDLAQEAGEADDTAGAPSEGARDHADTGEEAQLEAQDAEPTDEDSAATSGGDLPVVVDQQREFAGRRALVAHASDRPEATRLLGTGPRRAAELADRSAATLRRAEPFADGTDPAACLRPLTDAVDGPAVIARVERLAVDGRTFTAHVVVSGQPGQPLETTTLHVVDPRADCAFHLTERLDD